MDPLAHRLRDIVETQKALHRYRTLDVLESAQGPTIVVDGRSFINFCSNDYLGLANHPQVTAAAATASQQYGVGSGASALLSGRSVVHDELERRLAKFLNRDKCLLFSSGYLANHGIVGALTKTTDRIYTDQLIHASLIDAVRLSRASVETFPHVDYDELSVTLTQATEAHRWIVTDTVFSMDGDIAPLDRLAKLAERHNATVIADDAHGIGTLAGGRGAAEEFNLTQRELPVLMVTFGKALGTAGAAVAGSAELIDALVQSSRTFIFDTAPPPMIAAATIAALEEVENHRDHYERLQENIRYFRGGADGLPLLPSKTPIQPIIIGDESKTMELAEVLQRAGLYVRAVRPPTVPPGTSRIRICLSAAHRREDLDRLLTVLHDHARATDLAS